jgi:hypothetical protein
VSLIIRTRPDQGQERLIAALIPDAVEHPELVAPVPLPLLPLGWEPGQRLEMDTLHGVIVIAASRAGPYVIDQLGAVRLPAALRHLCGIGLGPPLVLAAVIPGQVLVVHPGILVAKLLAAHYTALLTTRAGS